MSYNNSIFCKVLYFFVKNNDVEFPRKCNLPESVDKLKYKIDWYINIFLNWSVYNLNIIKNYISANINY